MMKLKRAHFSYNFADPWRWVDYQTTSFWTKKPMTSQRKEKVEFEDVLKSVQTLVESIGQDRLISINEHRFGFEATTIYITIWYWE